MHVEKAFAALAMPAAVAMPCIQNKTNKNKPKRTKQNKKQKQFKQI